jgi:hypothetical protein
LIVGTLVFSLLVEKAHGGSKVTPLLAVSVAVPVPFVVERRVMPSERQRPARERPRVR